MVPEDIGAVVALAMIVFAVSGTKEDDVKVTRKALKRRREERESVRYRQEDRQKQDARSQAQEPKSQAAYSDRR